MINQIPRTKLLVGVTLATMAVTMWRIYTLAVRPEPPRPGTLDCYIECFVRYLIEKGGFWTPAFWIPLTIRVSLVWTDYDTTPRGTWRNGLRRAVPGMRQAVYVQPPSTRTVHSKRCPWGTGDAEQMEAMYEEAEMEVDGAMQRVRIRRADE